MSANIFTVPVIPRSSKAQRARLASLLSDYEWHTGPEMEQVAGNRYGARLHELKKQGHEYERELLRDEPRVWRYRWVARAQLVDETRIAQAAQLFCFECEKANVTPRRYAIWACPRCALRRCSEHSNGGLCPSWSCADSLSAEKRRERKGGAR